MSIDPIYKRILLKLSGEALMGDLGFGLDLKTVQNIALDIKSVTESGAQVCVVIGEVIYFEVSLALQMDWREVVQIIWECLQQ